MPTALESSVIHETVPADDDNIRKYVIDHLIGLFRGATESFYLVGFIGSEENDIDLFLILGKEKTEFAEKYFYLIQKIKELQRQLEEKRIYLSLFPTFRLEIFDYELSERNLSCDEKNLFQLHLLVYPTKKHFIQWEDPMIVKTISENIEVVTGDYSKFKKFCDKVEIPPLECRINKLLSLVLENIRYLECSLIDQEFLYKEALHKTLYIVRYVTFNLLLNENIQIREISTWDRLYKYRNDIDERRLLEIFDKAYAWRNSSLIPSKRELLEINSGLLGFLEYWLIMGK